LSGSSDPFAKVKQLIQELIERLLQEAGNEANQKGWCDKAISDAEQKRDYASEEIKKLNAEMAELEAARDKLAEDLGVLEQEISELTQSRAQAVTTREVEKAENQATVKEAVAGIEAVNFAIDTLYVFYKSSSKAEVSFSETPQDDAPDAGFKNDQAYKGKQAEAGGIIGMMEVIESDFQRTRAETLEAEAIAEQDHLEFLTQTGKSLEEKDTAHKQLSSEKDNVEEKLSTADSNLDTQLVLLKTALSELIELQPACVDTGMAYQERVTRREDEIAALKQALCILNKYSKYGPDGAGAEHKDG